MQGTIRLRSVAWFAAGAVFAAAVTLMIVDTSRAGAAPGDDDTSFVPINPCRLADTRPAPDRVGPNASLGVDDTTTFVAHGSNGDCNIPTDAIGLSLNVTAVGASQRTFLAFWPDGDRPLVASLNPAPGQGPTPNAVVTKLSGSGTFNAYNRAGSVDIVIDVNGYYTRASLRELAEGVSELQSLVDTLVDDVTALRSGTDTIPPGVTASGYGQTDFLPPLVALPVRASGVTDIKFAPEPAGTDLVLDMFEDEACDTPFDAPMPEPGVLCFFVLSSLNTVDIRTDLTGLEDFDRLGEIFILGTAVDPDDPRSLLYGWAYTAP